MWKLGFLLCVLLSLFALHAPQTPSAPKRTVAQYKYDKIALDYALLNREAVRKMTPARIENTLAVLQQERLRPTRKAIFITRCQDRDKFFWQSDNALLLLRREKHSDAQEYWNPVLYDLKTKKETALAALSQLLNKTEGVVFPYVSGEGNVSPDGKKLLWIRYLGEKRTTSIQAVGATLEGEPLFSCDIGAYLATDFASANDVTWMSDSQHRIEFENDPDIVRRRKPGQLILTGNVYEAALVRKIGETAVARILPLKPPIRRVATISLAQNRLVVPSREHIFMDFYEYTLGPTVETRLHKISIGGFSSILQVALSPQGDRVAWIVGYRRRVPEGRDQGKIEEARGLWVYTLASKKLQRVDTFHSMGDKWPWNLKWSPDGKRLSFLCNDAIWMVPVPTSPGTR
jgi:hypothetical protein